MSLQDAAVSGGGERKEEENIHTQTANSSNKLLINHSTV